MNELRNLALTKEQKEILVGTVLGDAYLGWQVRAQNSSLTLAQGEKQREYLVWKVDKMQPLFPRYLSHGFRVCVDKRNGSKTLHANSIRNIELTKYRHLFYGSDRKKKIEQNILDELTPLGLAVWIMDDGYMHNKWSFDISTDSFTYEENLKIVNHLKDKFGIESAHLVQKCNKKYWRIRMRMAEIKPIVQDFILPMFQYKINFKSSETIR